MNMHKAWQDYPVPTMRHEAWFGDRIVPTFVPRPGSVWQLFADSAGRTPQAEALVCGAQRLSYADVDAAAARLSAGLAAQGIRAGERVLLFIDNRPEFVLALLALQRLGAIAVPVGVREQRPGLAYIARQCGAAAIVIDADLAERAPRGDEAPDLRLHISVGDAPGCQPWAALLACADAAPPAATPAEHDVAVILYTSGTTGHPKGAMLTHANIVHSVLHYQAGMRLHAATPGTAAERSALAVPASHVTGLVAVILTMLHLGGCVVVVPAFKADSFITLLATERISHAIMVPAMYNLCLMQPAFATADLSAWRIGGYGGAPMPVATIDALATRLPALTLLNAYGATETTSPVTLMPSGQTRAHGDTVGVPLPAARVKVMDDSGHEVPIGETGELWIAGPMVVPGYWANPEATGSSFTAGYWHSGDLGSIDAAGFVRVFDRKKDMLNRGGYKIYSVEVENVLMAWPGMVEAAIVGKPCPVLGERVHAFVHVAPGSALEGDDAALRAFCAARLADYKVPESITWSAAALPRNANGKLMKRLLRERLPAA
ncbi:MAG: class I adenylate-forming enzyme family protein [Pseudomonadota bacterium]